MTTTPAADPQPEAETVFDFPAYRLTEATASIDKANRRLARNGIDGRFEFTVEHYVEQVRVTDAMRRLHGALRSDLTHLSQDRVRLTLSAPTIMYGGWEFVATLEVLPAGVVAHTVPGKSLDGWRPTTAVCDHCNTSRARTLTYVVRNGDGEIAQVGRSCLALYLGVRPSGLWALDFEPLPPEGDDEPLWWPTGGAGDPPLDFTIALAWALSLEGRAFVSRSAATARQTSTADAVNNVLWGKPHTEEQRREHAAYQVQAAAYLTDGTAQHVIDEALASFADQHGDYPSNMRIVLTSPTITARTMGLAVSAVAATVRHAEAKVQRAAEAAARQAERDAAVKGYLVDVGEKVPAVQATITRVYITEGDWGNTSIITMLAETGHTLVWYASGAKGVKAGTRVRITGGTVKKHDRYQDVDQTVLTRVKWEVLDAADDD